MQGNENKPDNKGQNWIDVPSFVNKGNNINQGSGRVKNKLEFEDDDSTSFVREVNSSLAKQVNEIDKSIKPRSNTPPKKKKLPKAIKITFFTLLFLTTVGCLLMFTTPGRKLIIRIAGEYIYSNLDYKDSKDAQTANGDNLSGNDHKPVDKIVNILLIGIEKIKNAQNTDSMIIATMNTEKHTLKLTSLMRDLYVQIPGYDNNRLNSVYAKGDIELLYDTIELNFGVELNGYCMVDFEDFQNIVDMIHGVEVTLTPEEAQYLNHTNYISDKKNRTVVPGTQILNGNQALGYCRVRKKPTATESNDFGRTQRQRIVLSAIYDKVKNKNIVELVVLMNKILKSIPIETDITKSEFNRYLEEAANLKVKSLKTFRVPTDDNYENVIINKKDVLQPKDWDKMKDELHTFIYGSANTSVTEE